MLTEACWREIADWFTVNHPGHTLGLRPPVDPVALDAAIAELGAHGVTLPAGWLASARVHDGQSDDATVGFLPYAERLRPLSWVLEVWRGDRPAWADDPERWTWLDRTGRVRQVHFHPHQVPIAGSRFGDYARLLLDGVPGPAGVPGQLIARDIELIPIAPSFEAAITGTLRGLRSGRLRFDEVDGELVGWWASPRGRRWPDHRWFG